MGRSKYSDDMVKELAIMRESGKTYTDIRNHYKTKNINLSSSTICGLLARASRLSNKTHPRAKPRFYPQQVKKRARELRKGGHTLNSIVDILRKEGVEARPAAISRWCKAKRFNFRGKSIATTGITTNPTANTSGITTNPSKEVAMLRAENQKLKALLFDFILKEKGIS